MKPKFYRKVLKNGFTIIFEKRNVPVVSVAFAVRCGGINEDSNEKGISHYIEHMLYKGTPSRDVKRIAEEIERNGGVLNGFTDETITAYWCKMPSNKLNIALDVLSDMVKNPLFDEKELEKERKVIFEEIKMRKDSPMIYVFDEIHRFLYKKPFSIPLIGTYETMNSITREKIVDRFKKIYTPNNMILCVVGDCDFSKLVKFVEKSFGKEKGQVSKFKIEIHNEEKIEKRKGLDQANLVLAYHAPLADNKKCYAAEALNTLMAGGMSSRLFSEIREKRNMAYAVKAASTIGKDFAYNLIYVGTTKENVEKVKELILKEFEKVSNELDEKELKSVKDQLVGQYQISMEDSVDQMTKLLVSEINGGIKDFYNYDKMIKKVTLKEVKDLAKIKDHSFFALVPE
ncbi:insulinase family protein [Candidatus Pacearchaeota archaeon]|nr:insulinase family protein [Candidatus Pacearchaeota archaeon]